MFNSSWLYFAAVMVLVGVWLQQPALVVLAVLLLTVVPIAWAWNRVALYRVTYERILSEQRVFVGEGVDLTVRVGNRKLLPLAWVRVDDQFPAALPPQKKMLAPSHLPLTAYLAHRAALGPFERARWNYRIDCNQRGYYTLGPARVKSGDLFGLFEQSATIEKTDRLIVYPRLAPMEDWDLPAKDPLGDLPARLRLFPDPARPRGVRDYHPEDAPKHIHWRATARRGALQVKEYDPTMAHQWMLFLNVATFPLAWQGSDPEKLERVISLAASIANYGAQNRIAVGLLANGTWPESDQRLKILPSRDPNHLRHILEALAAITSFVTAPIETLLRNESPKLAWGATLVMITSIVSAEILAEMVRLRQVGRRLALISLDAAGVPRELEGIVVRQAR